MDEGYRSVILRLFTGEISFVGFCEILGLCFLCWFVSYLLLCAARKIPESNPDHTRNRLFELSSHVLMLLCGFFWILGFPVSLCIGLKDHFDFKRLESAFKAEEAKSPKGQLLELYRREVDSLRLEVSRLKRELHSLKFDE